MLCGELIERNAMCGEFIERYTLMGNRLNNVPVLLVYSLRLNGVQYILDSEDLVSYGSDHWLPVRGRHFLVVWRLKKERSLDVEPYTNAVRERSVFSRKMPTN